MSALDRRWGRPGDSCAHLQDAVHDYLDERLGADERHRADQHLLVCDLCRARVEQERVLMARLRACPTDPGQHARLRAGLLDLAHAEPAAAAKPQGVPRRSAPGVLDCSAPAQYRSVRNGLTAATLAVVGCAGAAMVVVVTPHRVEPVPAHGSPPVTQVQPAGSLIADRQVGVVAAQRADVDARDAVRTVRARLP